MKKTIINVYQSLRQLLSICRADPTMRKRYVGRHTFGSRPSSVDPSPLDVPLINTCLLSSLTTWCRTSTEPPPHIPGVGKLNIANALGSGSIHGSLFVVSISLLSFDSIRFFFFFNIFVKNRTISHHSSLGSYSDHTDWLRWRGQKSSYEF